MKLQGEGNKLTMGGVTETAHTFTIQATAKAFKILSDGLYSDKITAVIRELSCNAHDAHVAVGKTDVPFEVHLPNNFEPYFRVSDFGPGLSEEDIYGLYTSYFQSTKTDSNDYIGALGLGSKSPYSYCDSFTVTSYHGDTKKIYTAYLTEEGMPTIVKMSEEVTTDGRTGMEVQFPVKSNDYWEFSSKARKTLTYFPVTPKIVGNRDCKVVKPTYSLKGEKWGIRNNSDGYARAIQGTVSYAIPQLSDRQSNLNEILTLPIDITFEIGDLEVAASRETISMNKVTTTNITKRLLEIQESFVKQAQETIDACATLWDAIVKVQELRHTYAVGRLLNKAKFSYKNEPVKEYFSIDFKDYPAVSYFGVQVSGRRRTVSEYDEHAKASIQPSTTVKIVMDTEKRGVKGLVRSYMKDHNLSAGYEIAHIFRKNAEVSATLEPIYTQEQFEEQVAKVFAALGNPTVQTSSAIKSLLPIKPKAVRGQAKKETFRVLTDSYRWTSSWTTATDDHLDADVKYYINTAYSSPHKSLNCDQPHDLRNLIVHLTQLGLMEKDAPVFEASPAFQKEFKKMSEDEQEEWISFDKVIESFVALCTPELIKSMEGSGLSWGSVSIPHCRNWESILNLGPRYANHPFMETYKEMAAKVKEAEGNQKLFEKYWNVNRIIGKVTLPAPGNDATIAQYRDKFQKILKKYPLASISSWNFGIAEFRNIMKYMVACDLLEETEATEKAAKTSVIHTESLVIAV